MFHNKIENYFVDPGTNCGDNNVMWCIPERMIHMYAKLELNQSTAYLDMEIGV